MGTQKARSFSRSFRAAAAAVWVVALVLASSAQAAPSSPFVAVGGGVFNRVGDEVVPELFQTSTNSPLVIETGGLPDAYGKFRAAFGSNGFDMQTTGGIDREVDGGSIWTDGFTVTGGAGSGSLTVSGRIQGNVAGQVEMGYAVFASPQPFDFDAIIDAVDASNGFWSLQLPNAQRLLFTGIANRCGQVGASDDCGHVPYDNFQGPMDLTLTTVVPFTSGQTIYIASAFAGGVGVFGGSASFFNSASFGITAPAGNSLDALSGNVYAAAVPEPSMALLMVAGLALGALRCRRMAAPRVVRPARADCVDL